MMSCDEAVIHTTTDTDSEQFLFFVFLKKKIYDHFSISCQYHVQTCPCFLKTNGTVKTQKWNRLLSLWFQAVVCVDRNEGHAFSLEIYRFIITAKHEDLFSYQRHLKNKQLSILCKVILEKKNPAKHMYIHNSNFNFK